MEILESLRHRAEIYSMMPARDFSAWYEKIKWLYADEWTAYVIAVAASYILAIS